MIETGKILQQRYRIDKQIGQGGMGAVYVATDERFGSVVAIKETLCMDDNYRKAIEREARLLNSLKHTALPRVSDHFLENDGQFLVMEYIPGEDLFCILEERREPFPVGQVLEWADQLLDALDFLHNQENPVIHRDIKPQNLKVTSRGQIILLDFGLAKGNPTDAGHQTAAKSIFGYSRNYASLEQIQGTGTDPRSDLYSLAATLYHLLTEQPPVDALTRAMSVLSQQADPLISANVVNSDVPAGVAGVLHLSLDLNAGLRPESATVMKQMLREHELYSGLVANAAPVKRAIDTDIFAQKTRLMPGATLNVVDRQTDIKTEVLPEQLSQVTAVRPLVQTNETGSGGSTPRAGTRRPTRRIAAAALGALLLFGCVAAGVYFFEPSLFGSPGNDGTQEVNSVGIPEAPEAPDLIQNANSSNTAPSEVAVGLGEANTSEPSAKLPDTGKETKSTVKSKSKTQLGEDQILIDGDTVYMGNTKIRDGKVEMPDRIIDENGVTMRVPNAQPPRPALPPNFRALTPEQRRRLRILRQTHPEAFPKPSPN